MTEERKAREFADALERMRQAIADIKAGEVSPPSDRPGFFADLINSIARSKAH